MFSLRALLNSFSPTYIRTTSSPFLILFLISLIFAVDSFKNFFYSKNLNENKELGLIIFSSLFFTVSATFFFICMKRRLFSFNLEKMEIIVLIFFIKVLFNACDLEIFLYINTLEKMDLFQKGFKLFFVEYLFQTIYASKLAKILSLSVSFFYVVLRMINIYDDPLVGLTFFLYYAIWLVLACLRPKWQFNYKYKANNSKQSTVKNSNFGKTKSKTKTLKSGLSSQEVFTEEQKESDFSYSSNGFFKFLSNFCDSCLVYDEENLLKFKNQRTNLISLDEDQDLNVLIKENMICQSIKFGEEISSKEQYEKISPGLRFGDFRHKTTLKNMTNKLRKIKEKILNNENKNERSNNYESMEHVLIGEWLTFKDIFEFETNYNDSASQSFDHKKAQTPTIKYSKKKKYSFFMKKFYEIKIFMHVANKSNFDCICLFFDKSHEFHISNLIRINENKSKTISFVSHEIRTPLNCIMNMLKFLEDKTDENTCDKIIKPAENSASFLLNLVNDLLDMAQIEAGKFKLNYIEFDLKVLLTDILSLIKLQAESRKIDLQLLYDDQLPETIKSDPNRVKQIVVNLLGNALKFTTKGEIKIKAKGIKNSRLVKIIVQDSGIGIKEEDQKKLFQAFGKIDLGENDKLNIQGVGLGLLISNVLSKNLGPKNIESFQGLQVSSKQGIGTKFFFIIEDQNDEENCRDLIADINGKMLHDNLKSFYQEEYFEKKLDRSPSHKTINNESPKSVYSRKRNQSVGSTKLYFQQQIVLTPAINDDKKKEYKMTQSDYLGKSEKLLNKLKNYYDENFLNKVFPNKNLMKRNQLMNEFICTYHTNSKLSMNFIEAEEVINLIEKQNKKKLCDCFDILICDDSDFNILPLKYLLEGLFFKVDSCFSGQEAIDKVQLMFNRNQCCTQYKIIFMDVEMPGKDGKEASKEILEHFKDNNEKQIIIGCTGYSSDKEMNECLESGMSSVITKPVTKGVLMKNLAKYITINEHFNDSIVLKISGE